MKAWGVNLTWSALLVVALLVAVVDGYYDHEDNYLSISSAFSLGRNGVIIVEERTPRI
jgi:hypothetical protein